MRITNFHRFIKKLIEKQTYQKYLTISFLNIYYFCHPWCMIYRSSRVMNLYSKRVWKKTTTKKHCIWRGFNVAAPATKKASGRDATPAGQNRAKQVVMKSYFQRITAEREKNNVSSIYSVSCASCVLNQKQTANWLSLPLPAHKWRKSS